MTAANGRARFDGNLAPRIPGLRVELHTAGATRDERLREAVARFVGHEAGDIVVTRLCQRCGSTEHGVPVSPGVVVSRARSGGFELTAVGLHGRIGVDLEQVARVATGAADAVLLHPAERARLIETDDPGRERAALWVAKEAVLKALGLGLVIEPSSFALAWDDEELVVRQAPDWLGIAGVRIQILDAGPGLIGAATLLAPTGD